MSLYDAVNGSGFNKPNFNYNLYRLEHAKDPAEFKAGVLNLNGNDLRLLRAHAEELNNDSDPDNDVDLPAMMRDLANPMSNHEFILREMDDPLTGAGFFSSFKKLVHKASKGLARGLHIANPVLKLALPGAIGQGTLLATTNINKTVGRATE